MLLPVTARVRATYPLTYASNIEVECGIDNFVLLGVANTPNRLRPNKKAATSRSADG